MSWNHRTVGFERMDSLLELLGLLEHPHTVELKNERYARGLDADCCYYDQDGNPDESCPFCRGKCDHPQRLRIVRFTAKIGGTPLPYVAEEWLRIDDKDCDGTSAVDVALYPEGMRPALVTEILEP